MVLLVLAKGANVVIPIFYKYVVDALDAEAVVVVPISLLFAYGAARLLTQAFGSSATPSSPRWAQRAIRQAGLQAFRHLHKLSLRYHMNRKTGGVSRAIERGTKGIEFVLNFMTFNVLPTLFEVFLVCAILWNLFGFWFAFVTFVTIGGYIYWTLAVTEWRIQFRRRMNEADSEAHTKAIDSLLNFETVKYFGNEEHESRRFDEALTGYETAAVKAARRWPP